jgi:hypothetical protein
MENSQFKKMPILNRIPSKTDGRDGSTYLVRDKGEVFIYHKKDGEWYKTQMEKV